ncbi:GGDEF domain-containing protein [Pseudoalteromonas pernae]|uniref:GGDEF domain-containing protein n=1 Tax=Pseudoalteromonas pernae TaxID=3118054 RepID=UPI003241F95D
MEQKQDNTKIEFNSPLTKRLLLWIILGCLVLATVDIIFQSRHGISNIHKDAKLAALPGFFAVSKLAPGFIEKGETVELQNALDELVDSQIMFYVDIVSSEKAVVTESDSSPHKIKQLRKDFAQLMMEEGMESVYDGAPPYISTGRHPDQIDHHISFYQPLITTNEAGANEIKYVMRAFIYAFPNLAATQKVVSFSVVTEVVKTLLTALLFVTIFNQFVLKRLKYISTKLAQFNSKKMFTEIERTSPQHSKKDDIDALTDTFNNMGRELNEYTQSLEKLVEQRTADIEASNAKLEQLAYIDSLTNVANRHSFFEEADKEIRRARRMGYSVGAIILDLDHFKQINDSYGHDRGDEVLIKAASALVACLREQDCLGRIGGEEFAIVAPGVDREGMIKLTSRLGAAIRALDFPFMQGSKVTISIGHTIVKDSEPFKSALKRADEFLYQAKDSGRDCAICDVNPLKRIY